MHWRGYSVVVPDADLAPWPLSCSWGRRRRRRDEWRVVGGGRSEPEPWMKTPVMSWSMVVVMGLMGLMMDLEGEGGEGEDENE